MDQSSKGRPDSVGLTPANAIVVLLDSLNRHMLGAYGGGEFATPNLDAFAARSLRFDRHFSGSLPCIPARHDLLCGSWDFLWRPWGSIEIWEEAITAALRRAGVTTKLVTDHPHLFEVGGENYHADFAAWDYERGGEGDAWRTAPDPSYIGAAEHVPASPPRPYDLSRSWIRDEADFPGPRTMAAAARWLRQESPRHQRWMLLVDEFDPHEPFDTPEPYASMYDEAWDGPHLVWPPYGRDVVASGILTARQARQLRSQYGGKLTMIDSWFGRLVAEMDRQDLWQTTAIFVLTDHGHYLGERDLFGKPAVPIYQPLGHIPMFVSWPGCGAGTIDGLTTTVDLAATILDIFDAEASGPRHGRTLRPLITGTADRIRDHLLAGMWGREVHIITDRHKYARAPTAENGPLSLWSNRWSTMPLLHQPDHRLPPPDGRARLDAMPGSNVPVIRQPFAPGDLLPYWAGGEFSGNHVFDLHEDPEERHNLIGEPVEAELADALRDALLRVDAPAEQFLRLGL